MSILAEAEPYTPDDPEYEECRAFDAAVDEDRASATMAKELLDQNPE